MFVYHGHQRTPKPDKSENESLEIKQVIKSLLEIHNHIICCYTVKFAIVIPCNSENKIITFLCIMDTKSLCVHDTQ